MKKEKKFAKWLTSKPVRDFGEKIFATAVIAGVVIACCAILVRSLS